MELKTAIANPVVKPSLGIIDPSTLATLPPEIVAANAFDVFSHATDSYTALPYTKRERTSDPTMRPISQGANPMSDINCLEAIRLIGANLIDAVKNPSPDHHEAFAFSGMLAGIGFGNAGCHMPCPMRWLAWCATTRQRAGSQSSDGAARHFRHRQRAGRLPPNRHDLPGAPPSSGGGHGCRR